MSFTKNANKLEFFYRHNFHFSYEYHANYKSDVLTVVLNNKNFPSCFFF